ncbi:tRNA (guanine-N(7)-)-methyltransferase [Methylobacillus rhizosphaerae]|uniref:tRNA (guanine-N(7)-)-methyltransferase n=1 Tax=Methylobacillus rhizosphaerae TaxID=551994 RepID=A0A238Z4T8_9PROT|nr:tRNA (guanosine(46)-N7)-methyltransferase TrmB [Methylobacillus rhizosphaerae]SNR78407.1 tRNA (guanine-N(7)-)-methyltransferase [Methylobacillus rhizosphaerae]
MDQEASGQETLSKEELAKRPIRSFVLRQGRLTHGQQRALDELMPVFGVPYTPELLDMDAVFARTDHPRILEIGFGMGDSTAKIAQLQPERDFLGVEVHTPGVGSLLKQIGEMQLRNLRIIQHDAVEVLKHMIPDASLDGVHIFFPDPWHKKRHHKRRLIQAEFVKLLCSKLKAGAYLHVATDWQEYAEWVLEVLQQEPLLVNTAQDYAPKPDYRPLTKFENRGIKLGHGVWDIIFRRK